MRVAISTFGADGGKSGISQVVIHLIHELAKQGENDKFFTFMYEDERNLFCPGTENVVPLFVSRLFFNPVINILWHQTFFYRACKNVDADVVFLPAGNRRLAWWKAAPAVGIVHDMSALHVEAKYDPFRMFYIKRVLPAFIRRLDFIITISESSKRDIVGYVQYPEDKLEVIPLGVDQELFRKVNPDQAREFVKLQYGLCKPYVLYVSRLEHPGKNHVRLIQAFEKIKRERPRLPHKLVLAGSDWSGSEHVHAAAEASPVKDEIVFTGFVPSEHLPALYTAADVFAFPSLYEGFGLPVLEAMLCGTPVVCSNTSSIPEVAGDAALIFDPLDVDDIACALLRALTDETLRGQMHERGITNAMQYSWEKTGARVLSRLRKIAEEGQAS